jgi:hypothetical protein
MPLPVDLPKLGLPPKPAIIRPAREMWRPPLRLRFDRAVLPGIVPILAQAAAGAFPVVEGSNTGAASGGTGTTNYSAPLPSSITSGELLLLFVAAGAGGARTVSVSGWSELFNSIGSGSLRRLACFYKVATGSEGASVTVSGSNSSFWASTCYRISGYQGTPEAGTIATGSSASPNPPSLSPSWGSAKTLWFAVAGKDAGGSSDFSGAPTNYDNIIQNGGTGSGNHAAIATARRELEASSDDPATFSISSNDWAANTVAVRPA